MAYAAVASLSNTINLLLNYHENSTSPELKNQIISLHEHTIFLESFLEDFPDRAIIWEEVIRECTGMAENIVELLLSDSLLESKSTVGSSRSKSVKGKYQLPYGLRELERVTREIETIVNRLKGIHLPETMDDRDEELRKIKTLLRGGSFKLETVGIYGTRGTGKTTLATEVYNNPLIVDYFAVRAWCRASTGCYLPQIASDLLRSMKAESISNSKDDPVQSLCNSLCGRRYFIVFDDLWSLEVFQSLLCKLPRDDNGSRILLTTRLIVHLKVASYFHMMGFVNEDKIWNRLRGEIFKGDPCPSEMELMGKMIIRRCRGDYSAIETVSKILAVDQTVAAWKDVSEIIYEDGVEIADNKLLYLSYVYLPHHLRPCFLYLGNIFPNDGEINVSKLIKLWVAEGFLNESECKSFEEIGEENVEELVRRGLVWPSKRKSNGRIKSIKVAYCMREFYPGQAGIDNLFLYVSRLDSFDRHSMAMELQSCHRVSTCTYDDFLEGVYGSTIRTILFFLDGGEQGSIRWSIGNVRLLRVLDLSSAYNYDLPEEAFELFHLRFLAFHCGFSIPEAISKLENLQTLIICPRENGGMFGELPEGIWRMPQLRHLVVFPFKLPSPRGATAALENLQMLSGVVCFMCSRENLKMIPNMKKLAIFYTDSGDVVEEDYELHNLIHLQKLEKLKIEMDSSFKKEMSCAFPPTLKKLDLCGLQLAWEDMKIVASLPNLQVLKLRNHACIGKTWETSRGEFSQLIFLQIQESNLKNWRTESSHFPRLQSLVLHHCWHMSGVPRGIGEIQTLKLIEVDSCNKYLLKSAKQIQKDRPRNIFHDRFEVCFV